MPKLKTHSGTKDRVKVTKNGLVRARKSHASHFLQKKTGSRKRQLSGLLTLGKADSNKIKKNLGV
jgi:large subunit ribosomal protein L35